MGTASAEEKFQAPIWDGGIEQVASNKLNASPNVSMAAPNGSVRQPQGPAVGSQEAQKRNWCPGGVGWDGMGWDGMGWDGMGWDGMGGDGMGWDGTEEQNTFSCKAPTSPTHLDLPSPTVWCCRAAPS